MANPGDIVRRAFVPTAWVVPKDGPSPAAQARWAKICAAFNVEQTEDGILAVTREIARGGG